MLRSGFQQTVPGAVSEYVMRQVAFLARDFCGLYLVLIGQLRPQPPALRHIHQPALLPVLVATEDALRV